MGTQLFVFRGLSIETWFKFSVAKRCVWARLRNVSVVFVSPMRPEVITRTRGVFIYLFIGMKKGKKFF